MPSKHWLYPAVTGLAIAVMVARIVATYPVFNDTIDEPYHLGSGLALIEAGRHVEGVQHPPLARLVAALPVYLGGVHSAESRGQREIAPDLHAFEIGHRALLRSELPYWNVLTRARAAMLVFPIIAIVYVHLIGRYLGGGLAGCAAAVFFSSDPTLLGHASWVTTDVAGAAGFAAAFYHGLRLLGRPTIGRAGGFGVALGSAIACKFTAAFVLPALLVCWMLRRFRRTPAVLHVGISAAAALLALWACYGFDVGPTRPGGLPVPMPSLFVGLVETLRHSGAGHAAYLNGQVSNVGWWYYFPEALVLKSPIALLVATVLGLIAAARWRRAWLAMVPFAVVMIAAMASKLNIGIRHILPAIAMLYVFVAVASVRRGWLVPLAVLAIVGFGETLTIHPDYLAFFNRFAGGPEGGSRYLLDSNLDWGQDQARAKRWLDEHADRRWVTERVFGNPRLREWPHDSWQLVPQGSPGRGIVVISTNRLLGFYPSTYTDERGANRIEPEILPLLRLKPVARIGYSIEVHDLGRDEPPPR